MSWQLRFQRFIIFLDLSRGMVKGGPGWWSQIKECWAESERVLLRRIYGRFLPAVEAFVAGARALKRASYTMAEAFQGMKAVVAGFGTAIEDAWKEASESATAKKGRR